MNSKPQLEVDLSEFFYSSQDLMCIAGSDGYFKKVNPSFSRVLGYPPESLLQKPYLEFVIPEDRERTVDAARAILGGEIISAFEIQMICFDGSKRILSWNCTESAGAILAIARDMTELRATENLLLEAKANLKADSARVQTEQIFKDAFDQAGIGFALSDIEGRILKLNREFSKSTGLEPDQIRNQKFYTYFPAPDAKAMLSALVDGKMSRWSYECCVGDQDPKEWYLSTTSVVRTESGAPSYLVTAHKNITVRKQVEEKLQKSEADFQTLTQTLPSIIWTADATGNVTYVNRYWHDLVGNSSRGSFSESWLGIMHPDDIKTVMTKWSACQLTGDLFSCEYRLFSKAHDRYLWYLGQSTPVKDASGQVMKWFGTATLIDDQIQAKESLEKTISEVRKFNDEKAELVSRERSAREASRLKSEFLANMSHEIRTPLNGIAGMTSLLNATPLDELQTEYAQTIAKSSEALMAIINDILDLSKIEAGKLEILAEPFVLSNVVEDVQKVLAYGAKSKNISLRCTVAPDVKDQVFKGDSIRIRQVLFNLVQNSVKFTERGSVVIKTFVERAIDKNILEVRIEVSDTGIGIDPSVHKSIFQAFEQADNSTTRRFGGTGLGLSICKKLVEVMGGQIGLRSTLGSGSVFWITLPLEMKAKKIKSLTSADAHDVAPWSAIGKRVLVAEDHAINQRVIEQMLKNEGYSVDIAENGREAFEKASENEYDFILMDCHMPEVDGFSATKLLRQANWTGPIIALTADVLKGTRERCLSAGMDGYLSKPVNPEELRRAMKSFDFKSPPHETPTQLQSPVLDSNRLTMIDRLSLDGSKEFTNDLVLKFISETPTKISKIKVALAAGDMDLVKFEAHGLKSLAKLLGAQKLGAICADLEKKVLSRSTAEISNKIHILDSAFAEVQNPMQQFIANRSYKS